MKRVVVPHMHRFHTCEWVLCHNTRDKHQPSGASVLGKNLRPLRQKVPLAELGGMENWRLEALLKLARQCLLLSMSRFWYNAVVCIRLLLSSVFVAVRPILHRLVPDLSTRSRLMSGKVELAAYPT